MPFWHRVAHVFKLINEKPDLYLKDTDISNIYTCNRCITCGFTHDEQIMHKTSQPKPFVAYDLDY